MAYTIDQGYQNHHRLDWLQRGLLIGLPALALVLSLGALLHHGPKSGTATQNAKLIPIISSLSAGSGSNNNSGTPSSSGQTTGSSAGASTGSLASTSGSTGGGTTASSGTTPIVGGRGGGPTGGSGSTTGGTGGTSSIATFPCVDVTNGLNVTCTYQTCTPLLSLSNGQKAYITTTGTCAVIN